MVQQCNDGRYAFDEAIHLCQTKKIGEKNYRLSILLFDTE